MQSAREELQWFVDEWRGIRSELWMCTGSGLALLAALPWLDHFSLEARLVFFVTVGLYGIASGRLLARIVPLLRFRCPRCTQRFHTAKCCPHCGLAPPDPDQ